MFAVVNHLMLNKSVDEFRAGIQQEALPILQGLPGFRDLYFVRAGDDHAIVILIWNTAADAQNGAAVFGPTWFAKNLAPYLKSEQQRSVGEVIAGSQI
ncbi:MAG TPA: hypothetical protein VFD70_25270 [Anaerolineae bacterium]|nr:hypothetical protein [Anaerolineae bacterium]